MPKKLLTFLPRIKFQFAAFVILVVITVVSSVEFSEKQGSVRSISTGMVSSPTPSLEPTPTLIPTTVPTLSPKLKTETVPTPAPSLSPSPVAQNQSKEEFLIDEINKYRLSKGLSRVSMDQHTCSFAEIRAKEITSAFNHDGFSSRADNKQLPYPTYSSVTENIAKNGDFTKVVQRWINSPGHAANMEQDTPFVCVKSEGDYYAYEGWKP